MPQTAYTAAACVLATIGWGAVALVYTQSPGFNDNLLVKGVRGNERLEDVGTMYDHALYLSRQGYGYLMADLLPFTPDGEVYAVATADERDEHVGQAAALFRQSLQRDPSNAFTWGHYAQALLTLDDVEPARPALERAWTLASTTNAMAWRRQPMVLYIRELTGNPDAYSEMYREDSALIEFNTRQNPE